MDIETKIALGFLFTFVAGIFIGWYVTWQKYYQDKKRHEAFKEGLSFALDKKSVLPPPPTRAAIMNKVIRDLNLIQAEEYYIKLDGDLFIKKPSTEPTEEETA